MRTDRPWLHQKLVAFARANGLKAAACEFGCSRNTVRKWLRRHVPRKPYYEDFSVRTAYRSNEVLYPQRELYFQAVSTSVSLHLRG